MTLLLTVAVVHLMAVMSPGPDLVVCIKNTLKYSRATGIWTALGFATGILVHVTYGLLGIALLISQSVLLFNVVKLIGAAYLIYLGAKALLSHSDSKLEVDFEPTQQKLSAFKAWQNGFLTNLLNPKATLYFLGFFSVVIPPDLAMIHLLVITLTLFLLTFAWFTTVAFIMTTKPIRETFLKIEKRADQVFGGILILLGLKVATAKL
jgi:RhtB (resistance to homoserine/threonine) family protein